MNDDECIITHWPGGTTDKVYGYCIEDNYLVYGYLEGFYSDMEKDLMNFMNIARNKI
ncbi:MAG: hypothetical protein IIA83_04235 [Thaumarchaeota archaeon]|nr:hypothetical protein [Nitrososphaerota archaeon]